MRGCTDVDVFSQMIFPGMAFMENTLPVKGGDEFHGRVEFNQ